MAMKTQSNNLRIFLDDFRAAPTGWTLVRWPEEVITLLMAQPVDEISLDHDLGEEGQDARTGYDVLPWIEAQVVVNGFVPPIIYAHSSNSSAVERMKAAIEKINRYAAKNREDGRAWNGSFDLPAAYA